MNHLKLFLTLFITCMMSLSLPVLSQKKLSTSHADYSPQEITCQIHSDGSYDIRTPNVSLLNCYPAIDAGPIHPVKVEVKRREFGGQIEYFLSEGVLRLNLEKDNASFIIHTDLEGIKTAPAQIFPIAQANIIGVNRFFKQGLGFSGPSGIRALPLPPKRMDSPMLPTHPEHAWTFDSYLLIGLLSPVDETFIISANDHANFLQRSTLYNRQYRFGLIDRHLDEDLVYVEAGFLTEKIPLNDGILKLPALHLIAGQKPYQTFRHVAQRIGQASRARLDKPPRYHFCSWYEFMEKYNENHLNELLAGLKKMKPPTPIQTIQIDNCYALYGDWLHINNNWPGGLDRAFAKIREAGYQAGVWIGPFMVSSQSELYRNHPDWLLHRNDGSIFVEWEKDPWGQGQVCILDTSHPEAFEHIRTVFRTLRKWGVTYFKTDFMDWGLQNSLKVRRFTPGKTSVQYYMDVVRMIREEIGEESYWLGCISPYPPMIGFVDGIRVANDVDGNWSDGSTLNMFQETFAGQYFNNVFWQNDPDVLYLRSESSQFSAAERKTILLWDGILGGIINTSDHLPLLAPEMLKWWRFIQPGRERYTADLPFWAEPDKPLVAILPYPKNSAWSILIVNQKNAPFKANYSLQELLGIANAFCFEWEPETAKPLGNRENLEVQLAPHHSILYYISQPNQAPDKNMGLSGNMVKF